jgi:hypothetical protein
MEGGVDNNDLKGKEKEFNNLAKTLSKTEDKKQSSTY